MLQAVLRVHFILIWIRIRNFGSTFGKIGSGSRTDSGQVKWIREDPNSDLNPNWIFFLIFSVKDVRPCFFLSFMSLLSMCIKQKVISKKMYSYNFGWFLCEFITIFFAFRIRNHVSWSGTGWIRNTVCKFSFLGAMLRVDVPV